MATSQWRCASCGSGCGGTDMEDVSTPPPSGAAFTYVPMFQYDHASVPFDKLENLSARLRIEEALGRRILIVPADVLEAIAHHAIGEVMYFFREEHLRGWRRILDDDEASANDKFVATQLLHNAVIASAKVFPSCQDTGTAIVVGYKGEQVWTMGNSDEEAMSRGIWSAYHFHNLRYSQVAPLSMFDEKNTQSNLPAQFDLMAVKGDEYRMLFIAKGGGSANKSFLYQKSKALLNPHSLKSFVESSLRSIGTSACPPYHIALVVGGTSAELTMKTVKLASCRYYDGLPTSGSAEGRAFRDLEWEAIVLGIANSLGVGAQFGGKYFAHQARVIRLPRHGASCPVGLGVSCSADRQLLVKITPEGVFVERLVHDPRGFLPEAFPAVPRAAPNGEIPIDLDRPIDDVCRTLSGLKVTDRVLLSGPMVVARDIAHAKLRARVEAGEPLPRYFIDRVVYYAGPAKTPEGFPCGSFGPTTAGRMDDYADFFLSRGASRVTVAKGNRSKAVVEACRAYGGFYLGSIGGAAAVLGKDHITAMSVLDYAELGMEAVWSITVERFPAFIIIDDKGEDFFSFMA